MSRHDLEQQLAQLRELMNADAPFSEQERQLLHALTQQLALGTDDVPERDLMEQVNLALERFEVNHPTIAGTLRSVIQSLASMGI